MTGHAYRFLLALVCAAVVVVTWSLPGTVSLVAEQPGRVLSVTALAALLLFSPLTISRRGRAATMTFGETARRRDGETARRRDGETASVGLAVGPDDGADVATLLRAADEAMYEDKRRRGSAPRAGERAL